MKIVHIITGLRDGGAEKTLYKICRYDNQNEHSVISLQKGGKYFPLLKNLGVKVYCVNMSFFSIFKIFNIINLLRFLKPDLVQTWLVHGDFIGSIAARLSGIKNIVWNVRYSNFELGKTKLITIVLIKTLAKLSFFIPKLIVVVSKSAKKTCNELGYYKKKLRLITNGYNLLTLKPNRYHKPYIKKKFKIKNKIPLIGTVARFDPKQDHVNLLKALSVVKAKNIDFFCVLVGSGMNKFNKKLVSEISKLGLTNYVKLLDTTHNIPRTMNDLDIHIQSSSYGEGFPNVVAEAMACGTPCVVTNVGDAAYIVGKTGWVVPPKNSIKLAKAIEIAISEVKTVNWKKRCNQARLRIKKNFDIKKMIKSFNKIWVSVLTKN